MLILYRLTLWHIQRRRSYCCLIKISSNLSVIFASLKTPKTLLHLNHPVWIWCFTSPSISPTFCTIYLRYLNCVNAGMIWTPTFTFTLKTLRLLLKLPVIYSILLLVKRKPYFSKACLQLSNFPFNYSFDSPTRTISYAKCIHLSFVFGCVL